MNSTTQQCHHCSFPMPPGSEDTSFCCAGCKVAHSLLHSMGLSRFYSLRDDDGIPVGETPSGVGAWLEAHLARAEQEQAGNGHLRLDIEIQGIHCVGCVWVLEKVFSDRPGAIDIRINPAMGNISLTFEPEFDLHNYVWTIGRLGYRSGPPVVVARQTDGLLMRLGVTVAISLNSMMLSASGYLGLEPSDPIAGVFGWVNAVLATVAVLVGGPVFFSRAALAIKARSLHLDLPIALGILLAWAGSLVLFFTAGPEAAYFDTLTVFIALMLTGRFVQQRFLERNRRMLLADPGSSELYVRRVGRDSNVELTPASLIQVEDCLLITPGGLIPVDSRLSGASAEFSLAWINGEAEPKLIDSGEMIPAGAHLSCGQSRTVVALSEFSSSTLLELLTPAHIGDAKADGKSWWHEVTRVYVYAVIGFALLAFAIWSTVNVERAFHVAVATLVITCPCAIGLALPFAHELARNHLRRKGLFVCRDRFFDRLLKVKTVLLDKTGTVTMSRLQLAEPEVIHELSKEGQEALYQMVVRSSHPKSETIWNSMGAYALDDTATVTETPGVGLEYDGWKLVNHGEDLCLLSEDTPVATFHFYEKLKPDAHKQISSLSGLGLEVIIVSGDQRSRVQSIADRLGLAPEQVRSEMTPQGKAELVSELEASYPLMLGDGINDVLALRRAHVSGCVALNSQTIPTPTEFFVLTPGLGPLFEAFEVVKLTRRITKRNLVFAVAYNTAGVSLALAGVLSPLLCAVVMPLSSIGVLAMTRWGFRQSKKAVNPSLGRASIEVCA